MDIVGLIKAERFKKEFCKTQSSHIYFSCYHSQLLQLELVLIKRKFNGKKKTPQLKIQETATLSINDD